MPSSRRTFLKHSAAAGALFTLTPAVPNFLLNTAAAANANGRGDTGGNILVVVQLSGGNDGINTIVPYADDEYHRNRFTTRIEPGQVLKIDDYAGFHPSMTGFAELLEQQKLSIIQGVGYPNPDRSHFNSMDIWHTAHRQVQEMRRMTGWLGRYLDHNAGALGNDLPALHLGQERQPLAVVGEKVRVPSVSSFDSFKLNVGQDHRLAALIESAAAAKRDATRGDELLDFLQKSTVSAIHSSKQVQAAARDYKTDTDYPDTGLGRKLRSVAQLIDAGLSTRIYYVSLDGFDTHANQAQAHAALLKELSDATAAFLSDIEQHGHEKRVLMMTFSEFGRRVTENASRGTDHGAGAPMFLAGHGVKPGLIGRHPSLTDLDTENDLKSHTDFRRVYAAVLGQWLGTDPKAVLAGAYSPASVFKS